MLDYATQVSELEKIAKLSGVRSVSRALPALLDPRDEGCLVCGKRPARPCAGCASVSYCGAEHQQKDARFHDPVCEALRAIAEDRPAHRGLLSGANIKARNWDEFLAAPIDQVSKRGLSDLATRPMTLAHVLSSLGLSGSSLRVHVMAATQRELDVPSEAWALVPQPLELTFVGPEVPTGRRGPYRRALVADLPRPDLVIGFDCGILMYPTWKATILELCGSGVPFAITTFRDWEVAAEARLLRAVGAKCVLEPAANPWASLAGKRSSTIANDLSYDNAFVSAWR